jgi:patatin-like phospholipase/acyl hydrolase
MKVEKHMEEKFQILSLDGGGVKGLFSAAVLYHFERDFNIKIVEHFDLIVGTSTGGIIALGLGAGMSPYDIVQFYTRKGPDIFNERWPNVPMRVLRWMRHCVKNKFDADQLEKALKECFKERLLSDSFKRLVIPTYNISADNIYLFKTPHHERLTRDYKEPMWKVAMATSAAPTYFPSFQKINHTRLVDGGVWANNPTIVGISEAVSLIKIPLQWISVLSLGTTDEVKGRPRALDSGGLWQWKKQGIDVVLHGQSIGAFTQAQHLLGPDKVLRIDPKVPDGLFAIDKLSEKELLAAAAHESRHFAPQFKKMFIEHIAAEYKPILPLKKEDHDD